MTLNGDAHPLLAGTLASIIVSVVVVLLLGIINERTRDRYTGTEAQRDRAEMTARIASLEARVAALEKAPR